MVCITMPLQCLIRFVQTHETFRKPEFEALARLANLHVEYQSYDENVGLSKSNQSLVVLLRYISIASMLLISDIPSSLLSQ